MKAGLGQVLDLAALDHATIPNESHLLTSEALADLGDLFGKGLRVLGVAEKYFSGERFPVLIA